MTKPKTKARPRVRKAVMVPPDRGPSSLLSLQEPRLLAMAERAVARHVSNSQRALDWANRVRINNESDLQAVAEDRADLKRVLKSLEATRRLYSGPLDKLVRAVNAFFRSVREPFERADDAVERKVLAFRDRQRRLQAQEQARLQREAEEKARKEQLERERQEKARQDEARRTREQEAAAKHQAQEGAETASCAPLPAAAPNVPVPVIPPPAKSVGPMSFPQLWDIEVLDVSALPARFLLPNMVLLREEVRAGVRLIPGCRIFKRETTATRTN